MCPSLMNLYNVSTIYLSSYPLEPPEFLAAIQGVTLQLLFMHQMTIWVRITAQEMPPCRYSYILDNTFLFTVFEQFHQQ